MGARLTGSASSTSVTVAHSMAAFLDGVRLSRSPNTARTYGNALAALREMLRDSVGDPGDLRCDAAQERWIGDFATYLKRSAPATERLYLAAARAWLEFLVAEGLAELNLARVQQIIRQRARRPGQRLPQFPRQAIERVLEHAETLRSHSASDERARLRALRDRAFLLTLADTGLRVHEACRLRRGDLDWPEGRALLIGKGNRQAVVRFSRRSLSALRDYLAARAALDGATGRPLSALPVFARHDLGAGRRVLQMTTTTGRAVVHQRAREALGPDVEAAITPHSFRHYFVTVVLRASGGNLKLAQELARHRSITVTQRYAHLSDDELDRGYHEIFDADGEKP
jgi:integrase/recombinase XerC